MLPSFSLIGTAHCTYICFVPLRPLNSMKVLKVANPQSMVQEKNKINEGGGRFSWDQLHLFGWSWWSLQVATQSRLLFPDNEGRKKLWHKVILGLKVPFLMRGTQMNRYRLICKSDSWQWLKLPFDHHLLWLCLCLWQSKSRSRRSEVLTYHVHALHFPELAARYDQNCDCTWNMVIENEERFIYTPYTCQSWPIWFESFCVPNMLYVRFVCFFGEKAKQKPARNSGKRKWAAKNSSKILRSAHDFWRDPNGPKRGFSAHG